MRGTRALFTVLAFASLLAVLGPTPISAQQTLDVRGQVVNGTEGAVVPDGLNVLMLITGADGRLSGTGQTSSDAQGRFVFEDVQAREGDSYTVSADYLGVFYGVALDAADLVDDLTLTIFEITADASVVEVKRHVMVIAAVDEGAQSLSAIEFVQIDNPSDRTLVPDLTNVEQISFLRFSLPPSLTELNVNSDLPAGDIVSIGTGFAFASPVAPGPHNIDFSYTFPFDDETLPFRQSLVQGTDIFQVWIPEVIPEVEVTGLSSIDSINVQGTAYRAYEHNDIPRGQGVELEFIGLPMPGVWARFVDSVTGGKFWQVTIPCALGATLAAMLMYGLIWGYRPAFADGSSGEAEPVNPRERAAVVQAVAALDHRYQKGELSDVYYRAQRMELVSQVLGQGAYGDSTRSDQE
ncbi:MAG: hypothetical protein VYC44_04875 [Chloroflexota bacterium]|nr:hypothetical protein [Chloroflexota bacterium]